MQRTSTRSAIRHETASDNEVLYKKHDVIIVATTPAIADRLI